MPRFADPVATPAVRKNAPAAARPRPRPPGPAQRAAIGHVLQRRTAPAAAKPAPKAPGGGGLPAALQAGIEKLSGLFMGDVRVHRNSPEPAKLGALAYTKGSDIHLGPGQDQHLPHEAWHVVQQKQGRVRATTQLKGAALNEDAALETEADRMAGTIVAAAPAAGPAALKRIGAPAAVAQRKVKFQNSLLAPMLSDSRTLRTFIQSPKTYVMRDSWKGNRKDDGIHVLDSHKRYLLGEVHGSGVWEKATAGWTSVDKIREGFTEIPEADNRPPAGGAGDSLPLESTHVFTLQVFLVLQNVLNAFIGKWRDLSTQAAFQYYFNALKYRRYVDTAQKQYAEYCALNKGSANPAYWQIYRFHLQLEMAYLPPLRSAWSALSQIEAITKKSGFASDASLRESMARHFVKLDLARMILPMMVKALSGIAGVKPGSLEDRQVTAAAQPGSTAHSMTLMALQARRNRGMAETVRRAPTPVLVQMGDLHVEAVGKIIGDSAVKVRASENFENFTYRDASNPWQAFEAIFAEKDPPELASGPLLSGAAWWHANQAAFPNITAISELASPFQENLRRFVAAFEKGGAKKSIAATRRTPTRAKVMHYCWRIAWGTLKPKDAPAIAGVAIVWDHGHGVKSQWAAQQMVDLFDIDFEPSLTSRHISGRAIDMNVRWTGTIEVEDATGKAQSVGSPNNGAQNTVLHAIGATYGVHKKLDDKPHWSDTGG